ncbi:type II toxin-antitoxin system RelE/ParE family toxin [Methylicorpusculum oleiharenae]|uniref:type II toxin-antitoxin system RelE family toxin n=1 Tax=Methylicorpusculum oleiharenae TaxID=1338687 RepID=UPI000D2EF888|nr:type II toxin-antitoxin system RelE/ParE family toxin [Methylicorpusculum oleiharenae]MBS3951679.1 type II toxin-antitoxin system RelE/ParE family toxin [Methylomicrobium sp.]MCD2453443.1 type II toxin-antitoxin system RelE/ParE family toxin [Methylicorpusculum oleiharenae]PPD24034.1 MAG: type II toxin-antitoxin system mRNA interferase toxin, RelE/StbE family [Methylobacter sp.]
MAWRIELTETANQQLAKLDKVEARRITKFLRERLAATDNPRNTGKALSGPLGGLWRYRVGDYRLICEIQDGVLCVLVLKIGNRREVYK